MCRNLNDEELSALSLFTRVSAAVRRGDSPDKTLVTLIEQWLVKSEEKKARFDAQVAHYNAAMQQQPRPIEVRLDDLEKAVAALRSDNYARSL